MIERKILKDKAKVQLKANLGVLVLCTIIVFVIVGVLGQIPYLGVVGTALVGGPLALGLYMIYLGITYGEKPKVADLFKGFSPENFLKSFLAYILISLFTFLWTLLLIIPGIVKALSYSMTFYILAENPDMTALEAITVSKRLMKGHKMELFVLSLSFIPWVLLVAVTFGLALIYVIPYTALTVTNFYQELKLNVTSTAEEM